MTLFNASKRVINKICKYKNFALNLHIYQMPEVLSNYLQVKTGYPDDCQVPPVPVSQLNIKYITYLESYIPSNMRRLFHVTSYHPHYMKS